MAKLDIPLRTRIGRILATPNVYYDFPEPLIVVLKSEWREDWEYERALCPVNGCKYDGLRHGFNQHYARAHAPEQWQQKAQHIIKAVRGKPPTPNVK